MKTRGNTVRPGEQWFFYWKTSAALWEPQILEIPREEIIFIPLNWGLHAEKNGWDFGDGIPERDLLRLARLLTQHGRKFVWLLPLTPSPFLPNGGIPVSCARTLSVSPEGTHIATLDHEGRLHKTYSWFEPKVFKAWSEFTQAFGDFLAKEKIRSTVWGSNFLYKSELKLNSFLADTSVAFEQGFSRYLRKKHPQGIEINDPLLELQLKDEFEEEVKKLFRVTAETTLGPFWSGAQDICVLGGSPKETLERGLTRGKTQFNYFQDVFELLTRNIWVSSCLLGEEEKKELLPKVLSTHFGQTAIEEKFNFRVSNQQMDQEWRPFSLVEILSKNDSPWKSNGLLNYLEANHRWLYGVHNEFQFTPDAIEMGAQRIKFFDGHGLERTQFAQMLKLFLMGHKIVLNSSGLSVDLDKRLQVFLIENNLKLQTVNFQTSVSLTELGEGKLIIIEGDKLTGKDTLRFWGHIFQFIKTTLPEVVMDKEVFGLWNIRQTNSMDLNYLDVRRVNLYNPTSYKKSVTIKTHKNFAFMKMVDPERAQAKSTPDGVIVDLLPNGTVSLDFGHFEES